MNKTPLAEIKQRWRSKTPWNALTPDTEQQEAKHKRLVTYDERILAEACNFKDEEEDDNADE